MPMERSIVLLFGSRTSAAQIGALASEGSTLESLLKDGEESATVSVLSFGLSRAIAGIADEVTLDRSRRGFVDQLLGALGAFALYDRLALISIGRLVNSLGPVDPGRVFWRAVRRDPQALALLVGADLAIAADSPAIKTAWKAQRKGWVAKAIYDHRAASIQSVAPGID